MTDELPNSEPPEDLGPRKKGPKRPWKHSKLIEAILANEAFKGTENYLTPVEIASEFKVTPSLVYNYRTKLGYKKLIVTQDGGQKGSVRAVYKRDAPLTNELKRRPHRSWAESVQHDTTEALLDALRDEGVIGPLDRLKVLSKLIRTGSPLIKINAIKAIEDLSKSSEGRVGPPKPLTEEERVARLARLHLGLGQATVDAAYDAAFSPGLSEGAPEAPLPDDPGDLPSDVRVAGGPVRDLPDPTPDPSSGPLS